MITWFDGIPKKKTKCFVCFDIVDYYPSIKQQQLLDAINFAKQYTKLEKTDIEIILHSCKSILAYDKRMWRKKDPELFDVPMGSFHGAEVCDLVGLHLLSKLKGCFKNNSVGLYRDDGLAIIEQPRARSLDKLCKEVRSVMKQEGFDITIEAGNITTDFLDVTLDLHNNVYRPYHKPNATINYIHSGSNHPWHIKKTLPTMIEKRLTILSKNKQIFDEAKTLYQSALEKSNYNHKLEYKEEYKQNKKKKRSRRKECIYYNPPYCMSTKTNIGRSFLSLVDKHFDKNNFFHKIFNRSTVKVSYCCMMNAKGIIQGHNKKVLRSESDDNNEPACNCRNKDNCPVKGLCKSRNIIYQATITTSNSTKIYVGSSGRSFKERYNEHKQSFRNKDPNANYTELAKYIHKLNSNNIKFNIAWKLIHRLRNNNQKVTRICQTCNLERWEIARADRKLLLNRRSELTGKCPHFRKLYF